MLKRKKKDEGGANKDGKQSSDMCIECETYYDMDEGEEDWVECEGCFNWYHILCAGIIDADIDTLNFRCNQCS